nr:HAD-IA family hydrolase [Pseudonocardia acidicola]
MLGLIMDYGGVLTDGPELLDVPRRARAAGVRTALLSDAHRVPEACSALFDVVVLGAAGGTRKPDPEAFRRVAAMLGLTPEQCVVVDDLPVNVRGARAAGAVTVRHEDPAVTISELEILFELP